tara:strand:- start:453 stop:1322 length:870 start_codon:yes stop_codon:yes gene_type:complete
MRISKILLVGSSGFIGSELNATLKKKYEILKLQNKDKSKIRLKATKKIIDLIKRKEIDTVIHLASNLYALSNKTDYNLEKEEIINPTIKLFEYLAKQNKNIIFVSSGGTVYGDKKLVSEEDKLKPKNYLGKAKKKIEKKIIQLKNKYDFNYLILRPSNAYGKKKNINLKQGLIENALYKAKKNISLEIRNYGQDKRDYIHVKDFCEVVKKLFAKEIFNEIINISSLEVYKTKEVIKIINSKIKKKIKIKILKKKNRNDVVNSSLSNKKLIRLTKHKFVKLKEGLKILID